MPELPEVETVRLGLQRAVTGRRIARVELRRADLRAPFPKGFAGALEGREILAVERRAKYLLTRLEGGLTWLSHLGMSGRFSTHDAPPAYGAHDHVILHFADGGVLVYNDARRFGVMDVTADEAAHPLLRHLGAEPLGAEFTAEYLARALAKRNIPIKPALMDQRLVVGVGNIYASEALFQAGIHPAKRAQEAAEQAGEIVKAVIAVLKAAIASGGSSLRDFVRVSGETGYFQHAFQVYGRGGKECLRCDGTVEKAVQAGRATYFCAKCQK